MAWTGLVWSVWGHPKGPLSACCAGSARSDIICARFPSSAVVMVSVVLERWWYAPSFQGLPVVLIVDDPGRPSRCLDSSAKAHMLWFQRAVLLSLQLRKRQGFEVKSCWALIQFVMFFIISFTAFALSAGTTVITINASIRSGVSSLSVRSCQRFCAIWFLMPAG